MLSEFRVSAAVYAVNRIIQSSVTACSRRIM